MHAMSYMSDFLLACSSIVNIYEPALYFTVNVTSDSLTRHISNLPDSDIDARLEILEYQVVRGYDYFHK